MSVLVKTPGPLTTVQDEGRFFYQSSGIRPSGVMDGAAYEAANALVGNAKGEAVLEMTFLGATLEFQSAAWFALTGADMQAKLDGVPVERYRAVRAEAGQTLAVGMAAVGCRGYLAVRGGFDVPLVMGSRSTDVSAKLGGFEGRALKAFCRRLPPTIGRRRICAMSRPFMKARLWCASFPVRRRNISRRRASIRFSRPFTRSARTATAWGSASTGRKSRA